jgi:PHD/YefM family antitoxin component YafN of YafNO toxin-antitoxin module
MVRELGDRLMAAGAPEDDYISALDQEKSRRVQRRSAAQREVHALLEQLEQGATGDSKGDSLA